MRRESLKRAQCKWRSENLDYVRNLHARYARQRRAYLALAVIDTDIFNFTFLNVAV
jgi:hypothetical protein